MRLSFLGFCLAIALAIASPARATGMPVDVALVLAVDVSGSVDDYEAYQQRQGYLEAIRHPAVMRAILDGQHGRIALSYVEWAGADYQWTVIDWTLIDGPEAAQKFAAILEARPNNRSMWTGIGAAIDHCVAMLERSPYDGVRRVIDISGDGPSNRGRPAEFARDDAVAKGIIVNGLPILNDRPQPFGSPTPRELNLDRYYEESVIGGPGAFIVVAESFDDFRIAVLQKLIREIAALPGPVRVELATLGD
ncbi:DUF1194 domain-containing protein [Oceanibaculum pacificum]|uniref:VWFA domain-containing protein n=1 Tax=Oceanibaculum pacificum TaxID=580166 RepID=A0A154VXL0_9PROT|nr:DUF1194 domain-containing protein [Oceanibaculum pacificum]KZD05997.1 hypothetical protein AUP43_11315 [Oceanibaculum pacificum]